MINLALQCWFCSWTRTMLLALSGRCHHLDSMLWSLLLWPIPPMPASPTVPSATTRIGQVGRCRAGLTQWSPIPVTYSTWKTVNQARACAGLRTHLGRPSSLSEIWVYRLKEGSLWQTLTSNVSSLELTFTFLLFCQNEISSRKWVHGRYRCNPVDTDRPISMIDTHVECKWLGNCENDGRGERVEVRVGKIYTFTIVRFHLLCQNTCGFIIETLQCFLHRLVSIVFRELENTRRGFFQFEHSFGAYIKKFINKNDF